MKKKHALLLAISIPFVLLLISCGGPTVEQALPQQTVTVSPKFQSQPSPIPTVPMYRCGAWASNNAPGPNDTITIYARLTQNLAPVGGATASAVDGDRSDRAHVPAATSADQGAAPEAGGPA